jgi:sulfate permease
VDSFDERGRAAFMIAESTLIYIAIGIGLLFAVNIGASGAAATMGAVYGSGAITKRRVALILVALGAFAGALLGSGEVIKTVGEGIIPTDVLAANIVVVYCCLRR